MKNLVFLGGGNISSALVAGLRLAGYDHPIVVHDHNPKKLQKLRRQFRIEAATDLESAIARAETLIIAVRPTAVAGLLGEIKRAGRILANPITTRSITTRSITTRSITTRSITTRSIISRPILAISLAAGIPLEKLRTRLGPPVLWARAMPSPVCRIGRGLTAIAFDRRVPPSSRDRVRRFFAQVGPVIEMPERQFDAFCAAYSPSHGYHALATLARAAQDSGLDRKTALTAAAHALGDALLYWRESGQTAEHLLQESATPGGVSAATLEQMKKAGYEKAVAAGLRAGIERARRNAKL